LGEELREILKAACNRTSESDQFYTMMLYVSFVVVFSKLLPSIYRSRKYLHINIHCFREVSRLNVRN
jgi:hypothetical protein